MEQQFRNVKSAGFLPSLLAAAYPYRFAISRSCFTAVIMAMQGSIPPRRFRCAPSMLRIARSQPRTASLLGGTLPCIRNSIRSVLLDSMLSLCLNPIGFALRTYIPRGLQIKPELDLTCGRQNTCERDTSRNRAYTAVQGRFCNPPVSQVGLGRTTCARRKS